MEIKRIIEKLAENKIDSFWYKGDGAILEVRKDNRIFLVEPRGEIRVTFKEDGDTFKGENAVIEAVKRNYTDEDLNKLNDHDGWGMNNWFAVIEIDADGNCSDDLGICHDYDEALTLLEAVVQEETTYYIVQYNDKYGNGDDKSFEGVMTKPGFDKWLRERNESREAEGEIEENEDEFDLIDTEIYR